MRKLLLLLGASKYPFLRELALPAFLPSHAAFKAVMTEGESPIVAEDDCLDLFDACEPWVNQQRDIDAWLAAKRSETNKPDALLLYYVGHGGITKGDQFYMTINTTTKIDRYFSSIPRESLETLLRSSAYDYRKFAIIDCCFAAAMKSMQSQSPIHDKMALELREVGKAVSKPNSGGFAALFASSSRALANADGRDGLTQFTDGLLSVLRVGDPRSSSDLSFESVRTLLECQLQERYGADMVVPGSYFADDYYEPVHRLPFFPNRAERLLELFVPVGAEQVRRDREMFRANLSGVPLSHLEVRWIFDNPPSEIGTMLEIGQAMTDTRILQHDEVSRLPQDILEQIMAGFSLADTLQPVLQVIGEGRINLPALYSGESVVSVLERFGTDEWVDEIGSSIAYVGPTRDLLFPLGMKGTAILALGNASDDQEVEAEFPWQEAFPYEFSATRHRFVVDIDLKADKLALTFGYNEASLATAAKRERGTVLRAAFPDRFSFSISDRRLESHKYLPHLREVLRKSNFSRTAGDGAWSINSRMEIRVNGLECPHYVYAVTRVGTLDYAPDHGSYDSPEIEFSYVRFDCEFVEISLDCSPEVTPN